VIDKILFVELFEEFLVDINMMICDRGYKTMCDVKTVMLAFIDKKLLKK